MEQFMKVAFVMITSLPVMNNAPPSVSLSLAPSVVFAYATPKMNWESAIVICEPVRQIVPPLVVEPNLPKPVLL